MSKCCTSSIEQYETVSCSRVLHDIIDVRYLLLGQDSFLLGVKDNPGHVWHNLLEEAPVITSSFMGPFKTIDESFLNMNQCEQ